MKLKLSLFTLCFSAITMPYAAHTQEHQDCFMLDQQGTYINLKQVCFPEHLRKNEGNQAQASGVFQVPIERHRGNIPIIKVTLNDQKTVEMMVDTGATFTILPASIGKELGIEEETRIPLDTVSEKKVSMPVGRVQSINVGGAIAENFMVAMSPALSVGLLGQNFYSEYDVVIREEVVEFQVRDS